MADSTALGFFTVQTVEKQSVEQGIVSSGVFLSLPQRQRDKSVPVSI